MAIDPARFVAANRGRGSKFSAPKDDEAPISMAAMYAGYEAFIKAFDKDDAPPADERCIRHVRHMVAVEFNPFQGDSKEIVPPPKTLKCLKSRRENLSREMEALHATRVAEREQGSLRAGDEARQEILRADRKLFFYCFDALIAAVEAAIQTEKGLDPMPRSHSRLGSGPKR